MSSGATSKAIWRRPGREQHRAGRLHGQRQDDGGGEAGRADALMAEPAELARRLNGSNGRPLLRPDVPSGITALLPSRISRYLEADLVVPTDGKAPAEVVEEIEARLPAAAVERIEIAVPDAAHDAVVGSRLGGVGPPPP